MVPTRVGRYLLLGKLASGGMATVHLGVLQGDAGFRREVAIKRLLPQFASDPDFTAMLLDEARIMERVRHPNVVQVYDVVADATGLYLVMELVRGETLATLQHVVRQRRECIPVATALRIAIDALRGLHAAHSAVDDAGAPLRVVHRDVSPHNLIVGADGSTRVLDFGIAKALGRFSATEEGMLKGKIAYMPPEQVLAQPVDARADVYALAIVLWEMLASRRLFTADSQVELLRLAARGVTADDLQLPDVDPRLMALLVRALSVSPDVRFQSAEETADALEALGGLATRAELGAWVRGLANERLDMISRIVSADVAVPDGDSTGAAIHVDFTPAMVPTASIAVQRPPSKKKPLVAMVAASAIAVAAVALWPRDTAAPVPVVTSDDVETTEAPPPPSPTMAPEAPATVTPQPARPERKKKPMRKAAATPDCSQPYELDEHGDPRFKRECLK